MAYLNPDAFAIYAERKKLSPRATARLWLPELSPAAAQMRLKRRLDSRDAGRAELAALAEVLGVRSEWLSSPVRYQLSDRDGRPFAVGGAVYLFDHESEVEVARHLLARAGFWAPGSAEAAAVVTTRVSAVTEYEADEHASRPTAYPVFNADSASDSSLDDFEILLDIERRLHGAEPEASEFWLDTWAWPGWTDHLPRAAIVLRHRMRSASAHEAARMWERVNAIVELLQERAEELRRDA